jgi:hypothetical protein
MAAPIELLVVRVAPGQDKQLEELIKCRPDVAQAILLKKLCQQMEETNRLLRANINFYGPMNYMFPRDQVYQYKTVAAHEVDTVFLLKNPEPERLVGLILKVANNWFSDTYLVWTYNHGTTMKIEHAMAPVDSPKTLERGIPCGEEIKWVAHNNSGSDHTFWVLCDGFFVSKEVFEVLKGV